MLLAAAILIFLTGCAHSYLGERFILMRLFKRGNLPVVLGSAQFTAGTLRFAWHVTTLVWWAMAWLLLLAARGGLNADAVLQTIGVTALASALLPMVFTRGRHLSWLVFVIVGLLVLFAR